MKQVNRADTGVKAEMLPDVDLRRHLSTVRPAHMRQPRSAEQNGIGLCAKVERGLRKGIAVAKIFVRANGNVLALKPQIELLGNGAEYAQSFRDDVRPNAIALENGNSKCSHASRL